MAGRPVSLPPSLLPVHTQVVGQGGCSAVTSAGQWGAVASQVLGIPSVGPRLLQVRRGQAGGSAVAVCLALGWPP